MIAILRAFALAAFSIAVLISQPIFAQPLPTTFVVNDSAVAMTLLPITT